MEKELENFNPEIELLKPIPEDKFDNHMKSARIGSIESRRTVFMHQNEENTERKERRSKLKSSIY